MLILNSYAGIIYKIPCDPPPRLLYDSEASAFNYYYINTSLEHLMPYPFVCGCCFPSTQIHSQKNGDVLTIYITIAAIYNLVR